MGLDRMRRDAAIHSSRRCYGAMYCQIRTQIESVLVQASTSMSLERPPRGRKAKSATHLVEIDIMNVVFGGRPHLLLGQLSPCAIFVSRRALYPRCAYAEDFGLAWLFRRWPLDPDFAARDELGELTRVAGGRRAIRLAVTVQCRSQRVDWVHLVQRLRRVDP